MKAVKRIDPVEYCERSALEARIVVPNRGERDYAVKSFGIALMLLYDNPLFISLTNHAKNKIVRTFMKRAVNDVQRDGFIASINNWKRLGNVFLRSFNRDSLITFDKVDALLDSPLFLAIRHLSLMSPNDSMYYKLSSWIYNWHIFLAKIPLTRPDLEKPALEAWIERQNIVKARCIEEVENLGSLRRVITWLYDSDIGVDLHQGAHGPGSTSTGAKTILEKEVDFVPNVLSLEITKYDPELKPYVIGDEPRNNVFTVVAKDAGSVRPITMEPPETQYAQQSVKRILYDAVDSGLVNASKFVKFSDQRPSRVLALKGSKISNSDSSPITIDLSSASDYLSLELIRRVFSGRLLEELLLTRTPRTETKAGIVELGMYAGMGSACTFPVQTLVFTGIALMATCMSLYVKVYGVRPEYDEAISEFLRDDLLDKGHHNSVYSKYFKSIRIYGDDIIVPKISTDEVLSLLTGFGLQVNQDKSFYGDSPVREACGIFALAGRDITPVRYRVTPYKLTGSAEYAVYESLRSLVNSSFLKGYSTLYRGAIRWLLALRPHISDSDRDRKSYTLYTKGMARRRAVDRVNFGPVRPLFEEFRGEHAHYIGILTLRKIDTDSYRINGLCVQGVTTLAPKLKTGMDLLAEKYHYSQHVYKQIMLASRATDDVRDSACDPDLGIKLASRAFYLRDELHNFDSDSQHGRVPRNLRLYKRIAYRREIQPERMAWAWAPK